MKLSSSSSSRLALSLALSLLLTLVSCDADHEYDTSHQCYFTFDTQLHNTSIIRNALNPLASGIFAWVYTTPSNGITVVNTQLNDGRTNGKDNITTAKESYQSYILGMSNGLLLGYSSLGNGLFAFDRQCPNCTADYNLYKYPLTWTNNGQWVECKSCHRKYDLNNYGFIVEGDKGSKLIRYKAYYDGNVLTVRN